MREKITYIANDETEFNTKEECMAYEATRKGRFQEMKNHVIAFDDYGKILNFNNEDDFIRIYNDIMYLIITEDISRDSIQFIDDSGYCAIPTNKGVYHYNSVSYEWDDYSIWQPIKEYIKEYI